MGPLEKSFNLWHANCENSVFPLQKITLTVTSYTLKLNYFVDFHFLHLFMLVSFSYFNSSMKKNFFRYIDNTILISQGTIQNMCDVFVACKIHATLIFIPFYMPCMTFHLYFIPAQDNTASLFIHLIKLHSNRFSFQHLLEITENYV